MLHLSADACTEYTPKTGRIHPNLVTRGAHPKTLPLPRGPPGGLSECALGLPRRVRGGCTITAKCPHGIVLHRSGTPLGAFPSPPRAPQWLHKGSRPGKTGLGRLPDASRVSPTSPAVPMGFSRGPHVPTSPFHGAHGSRLRCPGGPSDALRCPWAPATVPKGVLGGPTVPYGAHGSKLRCRNGVLGVPWGPYVRCPGRGGGRARGARGLLAVRADAGLPILVPARSRVLE